MGLLDGLTDDPTMSFAMGLLNASGPSARPVSLGQGIAQGYQQMSEAKKAQQAAQLQALQLQHMRMQMDAEKQKMADADAMRNFDFSQYYQSPQQQAIANGGPTIENAAKIPTLQPHFDQAGMIRGLMQSKSPVLMQKGMEMLTKEDAPIALADGGMLVTKSGKKLVENPKADSIPSAIKEYNFATGQGFKGTFQDFVLQQKNAGAGKTTVFNNTKDDFKNERDLRNDFAGLPTTKAFDEVKSAYKQITFALDNPSAANDLAAATKIMKMLDPGSVVRESELGMAMAATGKLDQLSNYANMIKTGQKLTPSQRADFKATAQGLFDAAASTYNESAGKYRGIASTYNLNPDRIATPAELKKAEKKSSVSAGGWSATVVK